MPEKHISRGDCEFLSINTDASWLLRYILHSKLVLWRHQRSVFYSEPTPSIDPVTHRRTHTHLGCMPSILAAGIISDHILWNKQLDDEKLTAFLSQPWANLNIFFKVGIEARTMQLETLRIWWNCHLKLSGNFGSSSSPLVWIRTVGQLMQSVDQGLPGCSSYDYRMVGYVGMSLR